METYSVNEILNAAIFFNCFILIVFGLILYSVLRKDRKKKKVGYPEIVENRLDMDWMKTK
jgi:hypothetical protein